MRSRAKGIIILTTAMMLSMTACGGSYDSTGSSGSSGSASVNTSDSMNKSESYGMVDNNIAYDDLSDIEISEDNTDTEVETEVENEKTSSNTNNTDSKLYESKLVYKCNIQIETLDFEKSYNTLKSLMNKYDCIIESEQFDDQSISYFNYSYDSSEYRTGKTDNIVIRVPSKDYQNFVNEYGELGNIISKEQTVDNITQEYYDTTSQVEGLKMQMDRLQEMLKQATDVQDMITINSEITTLQNQINNLTTYIRTMDSDVAYSYVTLTLKEVIEYSEKEELIKTNTFIDRLKNQCKDTWEGFLEFLENLLFAIIGLLPAILIIGIIFIIIRITCKDKIKAYKKNKKSKRKENMTDIDYLLKYDETKGNKIKQDNSEVMTNEQKKEQ